MSNETGGNGAHDDKLEGLHRHERERIRESVHRMVDELFDLERSTSPDGGDETAKNKGIRACNALEKAGSIVGLTAGWAMDHYIGMARQKIVFIPAAPARNRNLPEHLETRREVDDHQLERDGARTRDKELEPEQARTLLYNLMLTNPGAFPEGVRQALKEAVAALEHGETLPLFEPSPRARFKKVKYRDLHRQLWALALVEYRMVARGMKALDAQEEVAAAYKVDPETLRKWRVSVRGELGNLYVARVIDRAHNRGTWTKAARTGKASSDKALQGEGMYGDDALEKAGQEYQERARPSTSQKPVRARRFKKPPAS